MSHNNYMVSQNIDRVTKNSIIKHLKRLLIPKSRHGLQNSNIFLKIMTIYLKSETRTMDSEIRLNITVLAVVQSQFKTWTNTASTG